MAQFAADARVAVATFSCHRDGQNTTIGHLSRGVFLTIPAEGVEILDALAAGKTVGEAVRLYERAHGETPDAEDFLTALAAQGFVTSWAEEQRHTEDVQESRPAAGRISPRLARRLFGAPVLGACAGATALGLALLAVEPGLIPGPSVLVFRHHLAALSAALFALNLIAVMVHELAHLLAARASDVPARIGLSHRLWIVVAETDMSGIWMTPRHRRYLAFLAGPLIDAASAALLIGVLWVNRHGWLGLSPTLGQFTGAVLWSYLLRLLWQCFVFVRTDFYYVLATALDCKNLLADTEDLLRNQLARFRTSAKVVDQSAIPRHEMRAIRAYSTVWLGGRAVALASLVLITLPVLEGYGVELARAATGSRSSFSTVDLLTLASLGLVLQGGGLFLWIRSLYRGRTQRSAK
jgi:putative peptide zinc metalloprotease protein